MAINRINYVSKKPIIVSNAIEYDIHKANISIALNEGVISQDEYDYFYNLPKLERSISFAKKYMSFVKHDYESLLLKYIRLFVETNNINESNIFAIRRDSILFKPSYGTIIHDFKKVQFLEKKSFQMVYNMPKKLSFLCHESYDGCEIKGLNTYNNYFFYLLWKISDKSSNISNDNEMNYLIYKELIDYKKELLNWNEYHPVRSKEDINKITDLNGEINVTFLNRIMNTNIINYVNDRNKYQIPILPNVINNINYLLKSLY